VCRRALRLLAHAQLVRGFKDKAGNVAIIFGLTLPIVVGGAGLAVETSYWYLKDLQLQAAADAAAYAAATDKRSGSSDTQVTNTATEVATDNGYDPSIGTIVVNTPPLSGPNTGGKAVEVILTQPAQRYFTQIFSKSPVIENARAVALYQDAGSACILALNPSNKDSVVFPGVANLNVQNCNVMSNSISPESIETQGSTTTHVGCFLTVGGVDLTGGTTTTDCPEMAKTDQGYVADPLAELPAPDTSGTCLSDSGSERSAGHYCGGMTLQGNVTLDPGIYVVSGGNFKVNAGAVVQGDGVFIYLVGDARVTMNGAAKVDLNAPTSGTYSGVLFMGDRTSSKSTQNVFNGTADSNLTGYLYFASQAVNYTGNFSGHHGCTRVIADTVVWAGSTTMSDNSYCASYGMHTDPSIEIVKLVE
jgi:hypothetical protein